MVNFVSNSQDTLYALLATTNTAITPPVTTTTDSSKTAVDGVSATSSSSSSSSSKDEETTSSIKKLADGTSILVVMQGTKVISQTKIGVSPQTSDNASTQSQMNQYLSDGDLPAGSLFTAAG